MSSTSDIMTQSTTTHTYSISIPLFHLCMIVDYSYPSPHVHMSQYQSNIYKCKRKATVECDYLGDASATSQQAVIYTARAYSSWSE